MDILFINPLAKCGEMAAYPLGLLYLESHLCQAGFKAEIYDRNARKYHDNLNDEDLDSEMLARIADSGVKHVGISLMTVHFFDALHCAELIRQNCPEMIILLGGVHPTFEPERSLRQIAAADIVVRGPGEKILERLLSVAGVQEIANLVYRAGDGQIVHNPLRKQARETSPPINYQLDAAQSYWRNEKAVNNGLQVPGLTLMITSQGCPGRCTFCVDDRFLGGGFFDSDDAVLDEIEMLHEQYQRPAFFFLDRIFRLSSKNIISFCRRKIERGLTALPWCTTIRADQAEDELAEWMGKAGCFEVYIGFESGSQKILDLLDKGTSVEQNIQAAKIFSRHRILVQGSFIYGLPDQTEYDLRKNLELFNQIELFDSSCNQFLPSPGSRLYLRLVAEGVLKPDDTKIWLRTVDLNAPLSPERNYSTLPYHEYKEIYESHANYMFDTCLSRRLKLINEYNLKNVFFEEMEK